MLSFWLGLLAFVLVVAVVLYSFLRFSVISEWRTRGADQRLRVPDPDGVEALCGFPPSADLLTFYRQAAFIDMGEFILLDRSRTPPVEWDIYGFVPMTAIDVAEHRKISHVDGIPIGYDGSKGTYFIARDGSVMHDSPNNPGRIAKVADNITAVGRFEPMDPADEG